MQARLFSLLCASVLLTGCTTPEFFGHVDANGYEVGARGTWQAVGNGIVSFTHRRDGKEVVR